MKVVRHGDLEALCRRIEAADFGAVDTETTGLNAYGNDRLFSIIVAFGESDAYYLNFQPYPNLPGGYLLDRDKHLPPLREAFARSKATWGMHNAKFDLAILAREGIAFGGNIHDTEAIGRLVYNCHLSYALDNRAKDVGEEKDGAVERYIKENNLISKDARGEKLKHYDKVPFDIIVPYGLRDAVICYKLMMWQRAQLEEQSSSRREGINDVLQLYSVELELTKVLFDSERHGFPVDKGFSERALAYERARMDAAARHITNATGLPFKDGRTFLTKAFTAAGVPFPRTEKGNAQFNDEFLTGVNLPWVKSLRDYRDAAKRASTYFENFLFFADKDNRIHCNIRQGGTVTGRMSCASPNLQNLTKEEDASSPFPVRGAFVPESDHVLVMIDYDQMEYRLLLNYSRDMAVINSVLAGSDVHQATADTMGGVTRAQAKTINFMLLYGGGVKKLAGQLGVSEREAYNHRSKYFDALGGVRQFTRACQRKADLTGYVNNWAGRRCHFPPVGSKGDTFSFRATNHIIQGGCADVVKLAMVRCHRLLAGCKSYMPLQVHDELVFMIHKSELSLVPELRRIMENCFHPIGSLGVALPLTCSVEHSYTSWARKTEGAPLGQEAGDNI